MLIKMNRTYSSYTAGTLYELDEATARGLLNMGVADPAETYPRSPYDTSKVVLVTSSRNIVPSDNGMVLELTATATLTVPSKTLQQDFACAVIPIGTTSVASDGVALLNGATTTLTRAAASNAMFAIQARASAGDSFVVTGS